MKINISAKNQENNDIGKISNPNIPVASDFDDILGSLYSAPSEPKVQIPVQTERVPNADVPELSLDEKVSKYVQMAEHEEEKKAEEKHRRHIRREAKRIEKELKKVDPDFAKATATTEKEKYRAHKMKKQNSIPWRNYMAYFVIITALSACVTFSKYISTVDSDNEAIVAKFEVEIVADGDLTVNSGEGEIAFDGYLHTDYLAEDERSREYDFTVTNRSEVTIDLLTSVMGNTNHSVQVTPETAVLAPGATTEVVLTASPATGAASDHITVTFSSIQKD